MRHVIEGNELSRPLQVDKISMGGVEEHIVASPLEREALAKRFGLIELKSLEAHINVDHAQGHMLSVTGRVLADVVQECVVTLEPVPASVKEPIDVLFAPPHLIEREPEGPLADVGEADFPEPIENGVIDLGELVAQHLAMGLNPYPRKEGARFAEAEDHEVEVVKQNPFAKLKDSLENKDKTKG